MHMSKVKHEPIGLKYSEQPASGVESQHGPVKNTRPLVTPGNALNLQRTIGNQAVMRLILDTKLDKPTKKHDFNARPSEPYREKALAKTIFSGKEVEQTRHHIIPWNTLSSFIRAAYEAGHIEEINLVLKAAGKTMMDNSPRYVEGEREPKTIGEEGGNRMQGFITQKDLDDELAKDDSKGDSKNSDAVEALTTAYCWMPGNLFLGPLNTLRLDDPDEDFERGAKDQVGSTFTNFDTAFAAIKDYTTKTKNKRLKEKADEIAKLLVPAASQTEPFPFLEDKWLEVEELSGRKRYYLKENAELGRVTSFLSELEAAKLEQNKEVTTDKEPVLS